MFTSPSQILCNICGVKVYYYGVIMATAITVGTLLSDWIATRFYNFKKETFVDLAPYFIFFGILGARLYYCLLNAEFFLRFPTEILAIRHGGISIHGAILGGAIGIWLYSKRRNLDFLKLGDLSVIGLSLGQSIGRWGNFFNSEAYGTPTHLPWAVYISPEYRVVPYENCEYYHPTFLYESILDFLIFSILMLLVVKKKVKFDGYLILLYLIMYSLVRIFVESIRIDSVLYLFGIPVAILVSVGIIVVSIILLLKNILRK